jgi:hypothetical protein
MFDEQYPNLAAWILGGEAWIELGQTDYSQSYVRVMDIGGLVWESERRYKTVAEALADADKAVAEWMGE